MPLRARPRTIAKNINPVLREVFEYQDSKMIPMLDLADMSGYSADHISNIRRGQVVPSFQCFTDIANALGFEVSVNRKVS